MRKCNLFRQYTLLALFAGSVAVSGQVQAKNDFDALLADVSFGGVAAQVEEAASPSASDAGQLPTALVDPVADAPMPMPETAADAIPAPAVVDLPPAPADAPVDAISAAACGGQCGQQCGNSCGRSCGLKGRKLITHGYCQPYTPPRLPTSTFYQYWRSNACNVNVWDGFRNHCHAGLDLSIHRKPRCGHNRCNGGCASGCDAVVTDCGPAPAEWSSARKTGASEAR